MTHQPVLVAYGMGVDSTAMLIGMHQRGERPDAILFADVGSEKPDTYAYLPVIQEWLAKVGFPQVEVVRYVPKKAKNVDSLEGDCLNNGTLPSLAFGWKTCSLKWKVGPQNKWTNHWEPAIQAWGRGERVQRLIGYDAGGADSKRCTYAGKFDDDPKYENRYPLQEWGWDRERCEAEIAAAGLPVPVKSACFFCPASKPWEIAQIVDRHPELADRIIEMERNAAPKLIQIDGLWRKGVKGVKGGTARPGRMTDYIDQYRQTGEVTYTHPTNQTELDFS